MLGEAIPNRTGDLGRAVTAVRSLTAQSPGAPIITSTKADVPSHAYPTTSTACKQAAPTRSPTRPKRDLNPVADKFVPIAQTHTKTLSLTNDNKISSDRTILNEETCLSRMKGGSVVEGKPKIP